MTCPSSLLPSSFLSFPFSLQSFLLFFLFHTVCVNPSILLPPSFSHSLPICPSLPLLFRLSALPLYLLPVRLSVLPFLCSSIFLPFHYSFCPFVSLSFPSSALPSFCPSIIPSARPPLCSSIPLSFSPSIHSTGFKNPLLTDKNWREKTVRNTGYCSRKKPSYLVHTFKMNITCTCMLCCCNSCYLSDAQWKLLHVPCQLCEWLWANSPKRTGETICYPSYVW